MKAFVVFAFFVVAVIAKDDEVLPFRTRICKEGEFPGQRTRRQVADVMAPKPCWFIPNKKIATAEDCEETYKQTKTCEMSQVFVPLGQTKVCIKFASTAWFLTDGTNGYCGESDCCEWYPKESDNVVFCTPKRPLLNWFPLEAGKKCEEITDKKSTMNVGVEIIKGAARQEKQICVAVNNSKQAGDIKFVNAMVKLSDNCGGGCCIFQLV